MDTTKCLLCKTGKPYHIKSHLTPAGITENTYGKRNEELIYTIDSEQKSIDKYYGPEHPQTETIEIKKAPNSRKGIFCKECENKLGRYESEVQKGINDLINMLGKGGYKINRTKTGIKYVDIPIHPNILIPYFQSIVWRQCIEQILNGKESVLKNEDLESLRLTVLNNISTPLKNIVDVDLSNDPKMSLFTTYNTKMPNVPSFANPSPIDSNPILYYIGPINLLYWANNDLSHGFTKKTMVPNGLLSDELYLNNSRIAVLTDGQWSKIGSILVKLVADRFES